MAKDREEPRQSPLWLTRAKAARHGERPHRTAVNLSEDAIRRLRAAKAYENVDFSQIIDALITTQVIGYTVSLRGSGDREEAA